MNTRAQTLLTILFLLPCGSKSGSAQNHPFSASSQIRAIKKVLPAGWKISEQRYGAVPEGLANRETGCYLKLEGHEKVYAPCRINGIPNMMETGIEFIDIWIMPSYFQPKKLNFFMRMFPAPEFTVWEASNPSFKLYVGSFETPSWPRWGDAIYHALNIVPEGN